jgi:hypothetical protein
MAKIVHALLSSKVRETRENEKARNPKEVAGSRAPWDAW